jgi:squalene-hopene/tetraprenyl-beta-curcumene cyclase
MAAESSYHLARNDGHWCGEVGSNVSMTAEYVLLYHSLGLEKRLDTEAIISWLLSDQRTDGSWSLAHDFEGDISMTTEAYLALKLLGVELDHPAMRKARHFALSVGGVAKVRMLTRCYLAMFGLFPWTAVPELPPELILAPDSAFINIYRLSSWTRGVIIPLLVMRHHQPIYPLPNGLSASNDYLDELWCNPTDKLVPYSPSGFDPTQISFLAIDYLLHFFGRPLRVSPLRRHAVRECISWILEHQDKEGDWTGFYPSTAQNIMALRLEGFGLESSPVRRGIEAVERLAWQDNQGKRIQVTSSPVWDTVLMTIALCDTGMPSSRDYTEKAIQWVKSNQILETTGDWQVYRPQLAPGGFCFQYFNRFCPDFDDTAAAILAMVKQDGSAVKSDAVLRATEFLLELQNWDGGWGAFEVDNDSLFLNKIPFGDMDCLSDPSTADITGRVLEAWGLLLERSQHEDTFPGHLISRLRQSADRAIAYLIATQESTGPWSGRWGVNYIYGTSNALCGFARFADISRSIPDTIAPALDWLKSIQNTDGGWGESVLSYKDTKYAGMGPSTASQTAWALMALLPFVPATDTVVVRGIQYLLRAQTKSLGKGLSWPESHFTGVGFINWYYMKYELYPHYFPMMALARWAKAAAINS